jgi:UDP-N-acetylglucosamine 4,6-dehydratase
MKILVTGATGFFGQAFIRFASNLHIDGIDIEKLAAFARSESRLATLTHEYRGLDSYRPFLGDIRDYNRLVDACRGIDVVVHAAALKRVDDGSYNPSEMVATNIMGTQNVIRAATQAGVGKVVFVSSDKAVESINVYGATKFCGEQFAISYNSISAPLGTSVCVVRYGNVIGSTGSVLEVWRKQQAAGDPITITDPTMTRFLMTVDDACGLVFDSILHGKAGDIFIPRLRSASLSDIVDAFAPDHPIESTGFRVGGEKVAESLLNEDEERRAVLCSSMDPPFARFRVVVPPHNPPWTTQNHYGAMPTQAGIALPYRSDNPSYLMANQDEVVRFLGRAIAESYD